MGLGGYEAVDGFVDYVGYQRDVPGDAGFVPTMTDEERKWVQAHLRPYLANRVKTFRPTLEAVKLDRREWVVALGFGLNRREYVGHFRLRRPFYARLVAIGGLRREATPTSLVQFPYKETRVLFEKGTAIPKGPVL